MVTYTKKIILSKLNTPPSFFEWIGYETPTEKLHQGKNMCLNTPFPDQSGSSIVEKKFPKELISMVS